MLIFKRLKSVVLPVAKALHTPCEGLVLGIGRVSSENSVLYYVDLSFG